MSLNKELCWNVYRINLNTDDVEVFNVFDSYGFSSGVEKLSKLKLSKSEFAKKLLFEVTYCFWCKAEHEIYISSLVRPQATTKVDIFNQLSLNWDLFVDYVWENLF